MADDLMLRKKELLRKRLEASGLARDVDDDAGVPPRPDGATSPLNRAQRRLWFVAHRDPSDTTLNVTVAYRLTGALDADRLRRAFDSVIGRHEILRTTYELGADGEPVARHHRAGAVPWQAVDISELEDRARDRRLQVLARREFGTPFNLTAQYPIRVLIARLGDHEHVMLLTVHHIAFDDESWATLFDELTTAYDPASRDDAGLPALRRQYLDLPAVDDEAVAADVEYWQRMHTPLPEPLPLPGRSHHAPGAAGPRTSARLSRSLPGELVTRVGAFARDAAVSPFTVHAALTDMLVHRITGATDFTVAVPMTTRPAGSAGLIGYFGNTLLVRTRLASDDTFAALTAAAGARLTEAFTHHAAPVDAVVGAINPDRGTGADGLTQLVAVSLSARGDVDGLRLDGVTAGHLDHLSTPNGQLPLELSIVDGADPHLDLEYDSAVFTGELADQIADTYLHLLEQALAHPDTPIRDLELLDTAAYARVLAASTGRRSPVAPTTVVDLFGAASAARPDHEAVVSDDRTLTYRELDEESNRLAHWLIGAGIGPEDLVGLRLRASVGFVVAALAALKAGAAYLPIDPDYPANRSEFLLADAAPRLVLDAEGLADAEKSAASCSTLAPTDDHRRAPLRPGNLAYVIYTSGSTGTPKGVPVAHHAIADHLIGFGAGEVLAPDDRLVQTSSVSFDASMFEIFCTLAVGATLVIPKPKAVQDISYMAELLVRQRVTVMHMVPTLLSTLLMVPEVKQWTMLRTVPVGGEALSGEIADAFTTTFDAALSNNYGPTEAVVAATHYPVDGPQGNVVVPIGTPNTNVTSYLLDPGLHLVPDGVVGEIHLGGEQLARGYLGRPALTATRFVADPFSDGGRLYRTGDLALRNADGDLEFVGRADEQVKVRGFRIELGEVEAALAGHPDVAHALVLVESADTGARLVAYVIPEPAADGAPDLDDVLRRVRATLPEYMVPAGLAVIDEVPLTVHGKLDRDALPLVAAASVADDRVPQTPTEKRIAAVFGEIFARDDVGAGASFFDLGGHSLLAARLVTTLSNEFGIDVDVRLPLDHPTVAALAAAIRAAVLDEYGLDLDDLGDADDATVEPVAPSAPSEAMTGVRRPPLEHVEAPSRAPLSFSQLAMWFQQRFSGAGAAGNIPLAIRVDRPLDRDVLRAALDDVLARHEALRTTFTERDGLPTAHIADHVHIELPLVEVPDEAALNRALAQARNHEFDLAAAPLVRATLFARDGSGHVLSLVVHHMVIDHASTEVVLDDLVAAYRARAAGGEPRFAAPELTYTDFAVWQHRVFPVGDASVVDEFAEFGRREIEHWRSALDGAPDEITVATDRPRPVALGKAGVLADFTISAATRQAVRRVSDECGTTEFMAVTAVLAGLLSRLGGGDDITIGTPVAGRVDPGTETLVGLYANMVALRTRVEPGLTVAGLLGRGRDAVLDAFAHQDVPIERLVESLNPRRTRSRNPLFQSMIHFRDRDQNAWGRPLDDAGRATLTLLPVEQDTSLLDLNLNLVVTEDGGIDGRLVAAADLYDQDTAEAIAAAFLAAYAGVAAGADTLLSDIELPALPRVLIPDQHHDDPQKLAALIVERHPRRVHAGPRTLAALQHTGTTDLSPVVEWVLTEPGAVAALAESLAALAPGSRLVNPFDEVPPAPAVVALAATAGGGAQTRTEERLIAILADLLGVDGLGRDDNFFAVGGDSVISIQWAARAAAEGLAMSPQQIFDYYSIAELAAAVDAGETGTDAGSTDTTPADTAPIDDAAPMSASGLSDDLLASLGAAWQDQQ